jgi:hypothetical protein
MTVISKTWYHSRRLNCIIAMYTYIPVKLSTGNYTNIVMMYICVLFVFFLCVVYLMLSVSLDCPFLNCFRFSLTFICASVFIQTNVHHYNISNTQPMKNHNTENKKGEQHSTNQKSQHRKLKMWATLNQPKITTQKTKKVSNTQPTKNFTFLVFCVVIFGWLSVAHLFSFLCCDFWLVECCSPF